MYNYRDTFGKVLELLDYLFDFDFLKKDWHDARTALLPNIERKAVGFRKMQFSIRAYQLTLQQFKDFFKKQVANNEIFVTRAKALFKGFTSHDTQLDVGETQELDPQVIDEDIIFNIEEDYRPDYDIQELSKGKLSLQDRLLIYLYNLDLQLAKRLLGQGSTSSDMLSILEVEEEDFNELLISLFPSIQEEDLREMYYLLKDYGKSKRVSVLRVMVALAVSYTESQA